MLSIGNHVNYPDQNETEQQAQPGSKLDEALQNLGKYGSCQFRNYVRETGLQKPSDQRVRLCSSLRGNFQMLSS